MAMGVAMDDPWPWLLCPGPRKGSGGRSMVREKQLRSRSELCRLRPWPAFHSLLEGISLVGLVFQLKGPTLHPGPAAMLSH